MRRNKLFVSTMMFAWCIAGAVVLTAIAQSNDPKAPGPGDMKLPPGWTEQDMQACMMAATPGPMHQQLAKNIGVWQGKNTMWMAPGTEPMKSDCVTTNAPIMDGRFLRSETTGDMPGMGPFTGFAVYGFDNVSKKFQSTWIDNMGTGMMVGTGELSSDGRILTWNFTYNCPIAKKAVTMREIETITGPDTKLLEMWSTDPKSGKEYKMMEIAYTRKPGTAGTASIPTGTR
ncbi:MAG: DUF1579 domain-containing protein [Tepidisphaeraceae bacterium]